MKQKAERYYTTKFKVKGRGQFPFDMLRYDGCYPHSSVDAAALSESRERRTVKLVMQSRNDFGPTVERWASFCWEVVVEDR